MHIRNVLPGFLAMMSIAIAYSWVTPAMAKPDESLRISVRGKNFVNGDGKVIQLRGANISALEFVAAQGWSPNDPWGNQYNEKIWDVLADWKANVVRIPLNQASWLGYQCVNGSGKVVNPDPGSNYRSVVGKTIADATQKGFYVIVDLHWSAPNDPLLAVGGVSAMCPLAQNPMPDADHSEEFWTSVAGTFKSYPNVMFELFNEPFFDWKYSSKNDWEVLRDGGTFSSYNNGQKIVTGHAWKATGFQVLLDAVRKTGATNVVLISGPDWSKRLDEWVKYKPRDPATQLAAVWHAYPAWATKFGSEAYSFPNYGNDAFKWAEAILAANFPVIITEIGDRSAAGTNDAPFASRVLPWADRNGISYLGWTFNVWPNKEDAVLLKHASGTPTDGFGKYFKNHLACVGRGATNCP